MREEFFCLLLLFIGYSGFCQTDTLALTEVEVTATALRSESLGGQVYEWTTETLRNSPALDIGSFLQMHAGTYIKSYGLGSLATSSVRGGSAGHTLVLWNGLPLQSPMLGLLDLALLPTQAFEQVRFQKGGQSALWGSGAIGGVLSLSQKARFQKGVQASSTSEWGSFGHFHQMLKSRVGNARFQSVTRLIHQQATNDFPYRLRPDLPEKRQSNARLSQQNFLQDFYWKANAQNQFALHFWQQLSDRQIPPTSLQNQSLARQEDRATRIQAHWTHAASRSIWQTKAAYVAEYIDFYDDRIGLASPSRFHRWIGEASRQQSLLEQLQWTLGTTYTHTRAHATGYTDTPTEQRLAFFSSWKWTATYWNLQASIRQERIDQRWIPFVPMLAASYSPGDWLTLEGKISRNYRLPTLNDRYWQPGGNPDLKAESGWSQEVSISSKCKAGSLQVEGRLTAFNRTIDDWILWSIQAGESFWSANNINQVWSRGLEPSLQISQTETPVEWSLQIGYEYIRSTNQVALEFPRIAAGQQLFYTPIHQGFTHFRANWKGLQTHYHHQWIGKTQGINDALDAFQLGQWRLAYQQQFGRCGIQTHLTLHNLWNTSYRVIERRPMPGRHFRLGLSLSYN